MLDALLQAIDADASPEAARAVFSLASRFIADSAAGGEPVTTPHDAETLYRMIDGPLPAGGRPLEQVLADVERSIMAHSIRLSHPMYLGHQVSAPLPAAIWTDALVSALNNSLAVREMSPSGTAVETRLVRWMCQLAGLPATAGGTFTSGGTEATFTALLAARAAALPDAWQHGIARPAPVIVCGEHAHYAVTRAAGELGLGMDQAIPVPSRGHRMDPDALSATRLTGWRATGAASWLSWPRPARPQPAASTTWSESGRRPPTADSGFMSMALMAPPPSSQNAAAISSAGCVTPAALPGTRIR